MAEQKEVETPRNATYVTGIASTILWGTARAEVFTSCPIINLPNDTLKVRRRFRARRVAQAFVRRPHTVEQWDLGPVGDHRTATTCHLVYLRAINVR